MTLLPISEEPIKVPHPNPQKPVERKRVTGLGLLPGLRHKSELDEDTWSRGRLVS